jgi:hypothetical protein
MLRRSNAQSAWLKQLIINENVHFSALFAGVRPVRPAPPGAAGDPDGTSGPHRVDCPVAMGGQS